MFSIFSSFWGRNSNSNSNSSSNSNSRGNKKIAIERAQTAQDLAEMSLRKVQTADADTATSEPSVALTQEIGRKHGTWRLLAKAGTVLALSTGVYTALRLGGMSSIVSGAVGRWLSGWELGGWNGSETMDIDINRPLQGSKMERIEVASYVTPALAQTLPQAAWQSPIALGSLNGVTGFVIKGEETREQSGYSVSYAGDINGDRIDDVIIGAPYASPVGKYQAGRSYVVFGHNGTWSSALDLAMLDGINGFKIDGEEAWDMSGIAVSYAGDVNGDHIDDIIIGAPYASPEGMFQAGRSYVVFGHGGNWSNFLNLTTLDGINGFKIDGEEEGDQSGYTVKYAGDVNGDYFDDVVIGAPLASPEGRYSAGRSYVVFGGTIWNETVELSMLDGKNGFKIDGEEAGDYSGFAVSYAGDVNGDRIDDVIIGAYIALDRMLEGDRSYVIFGRNGVWLSSLDLTILDGINGFKIYGYGLIAGELHGYSVSCAGDINGDQFSDIIIGNPNVISEKLIMAGQSYVVFGHNGTWANITNTDISNGSNGFKLSGEVAGSSSGVAVSYAGDVNGDRIDDIIIGAPYAFPGNKAKAGRSYVVFGYKGGWPALLGFQALDGIKGFKLDGIAAGDISALSVNRAGDVNGDGIGDIIIGAPLASGGGDISGQSYIVFGENIAKFNLTIGALISSQSGCCTIGMGQPYNFTFVSESFTHISAYGNLTYAAIQIDGTALPSWFSFDPATRKFLGLTTDANNIGTLNIKVSATINFATIAQIFEIEIVQSLDATNVKQVITYSENTDFNLAEIVITTPSLTTVVELVLSDPSAGVLSVGTSGNTSSTYNATAGVWLASGTRDSVNILLAHLVFHPTANYYENFHILVNISDSYGQILTSTISVFGQKAFAPGPLVGGLIGGLGSAAIIAAITGYAVYKRKKEQERKLEIELTAQRSWSFDLTLKPLQSEVQDYSLISARGIDMRKVVEAYQRCPVPGMDLRSVEIVYSPNLERAFALQVQLLQNKEGNSAFIPQWINGSNVALRGLIMDWLQHMVEPYKDEHYPAVKLLPVWHGTRPEILASIFKTGFANLAATDEGFFGKGLYSAYEAKYAYQIYSRGALLVNWVSFYSAYPVVDGDMAALHAKGSYDNYDAHFIPVSPASDNPGEQTFFPCQKLTEAVYHEIVVFDAAQCLPRYLVHLQPSLPQAMPVVAEGVAAAPATGAVEVAAGKQGVGQGVVHKEDQKKRHVVDKSLDGGESVGASTHEELAGNGPAVQQRHQYEQPNGESQIELTVASGLSVRQPDAVEVPACSSIGFFAKPKLDGKKVGEVQKDEEQKTSGGDFSFV